jgi:hypothetical protein
MRFRLPAGVASRIVDGAVVNAVRFSGWLLDDRGVAGL